MIPAGRRNGAGALHFKLSNNMNMTGHRLFTLAALALLAAACNREALSPDEGREVIDISACFAQDATKAGGEKTTLADGDKIGVFACHTGEVQYNLSSVSPDFMYNQDVTYNGGNWTYSPVKYWPNNSSEYISFFSYYPYISSAEALTATDGIIGFSNANAKGDPWLVYKLPEGAPAIQADLMYGTPCIDGQKQSVDGKVSFQLNHALACMADEVTVVMDEALYLRMHNDLDISITGLKIVYSNLTTKARLVLNSTGEPHWKEVISGELLTSRTYTSQPITDKTFSKDATENPAAMTIDSGNGLFYIPLQIAGQPKPQAEITLFYTVTGVGDNGSFTDTVVKVIEFAPGDASKKQKLALTLTENFNLDAEIVTVAANGISMPGNLVAAEDEVIIDYGLDETTLDYTGGVQTFTVPRTGTYKLAAWGAKGGTGASAGAAGGYAEAQFNLSIGDVLYVYVGGKGGDAGSSTALVRGAGGTGGWNGGGTGGASQISADGWKGGGGGGGATHIAVSPIGIIGTSFSQLSAYAGEEGHLLLVAGGGGGGAWKAGTAGSGGGESGNPGYNGGYSTPYIPSQALSPWYNPDYSSYGRNGGNGGSGGGGGEGNGGGGAGYLGGNSKPGTNTTDGSATGGSGGSSWGNKARYNYVTGSFLTTAGERNGDGQVVITFVNSL